MPEFKLCPPEKPYYLMEIEEGKAYTWCSCGLSKAQPFCDGSHSASPGKGPVLYVAEAKKDIFFCGCKRTGTPPFCDGTHKKPA